MNSARFMIRFPVAVICFVWLSHGLTAVAGTFLTVTLMDTAEVSRPTVTLGDIARISSADAPTVAKLRTLEVLEFKAPYQTEFVSASYLGILLQLQGHATDDFRIAGPSKCSITVADPHVLTDRDVEEAAKKTLLQFLNVEDPADLRVTLLGVFLQSIPANIRNSVGLRVDVSPTDRITLGRTNLNVQLWLDGQLVTTRSASFQVMQRFPVVVTRLSMRPGDTLLAGNVQAEERFLTSVPDQLQPEDVIGSKAVSTLQASQVLSARDFRKSIQQDSPIVVKNRDKVTVVARIGFVQVTLTDAEALGNGRVGDQVRWRNQQSNTISAGTVIAAGLIETTPSRRETAVTPSR